MATLSRSSGPEWPQPCGRLTTPGRILRKAHLKFKLHSTPSTSSIDDPSLGPGYDNGTIEVAGHGSGDVVEVRDLAAPGADLSLWGLFVEADIVVKIVMLGLLAASVWVWAVVFEKWSSLRKVNREADGFEDRFWSGGSLEDLFEQEATNPTHPMAAVFGAAAVRVRGGRRAPGDYGDRSCGGDSESAGAGGAEARRHRDH